MGLHSDLEGALAALVDVVAAEGAAAEHSDVAERVVGVVAWQVVAGAYSDVVEWVVVVEVVAVEFVVVDV